MTRISPLFALLLTASCGSSSVHLGGERRLDPDASIADGGGGDAGADGPGDGHNGGGGDKDDHCAPWERGPVCATDGKLYECVDAVRAAGEDVVKDKRYCDRR
jgi:hypothetical protein